MVGTGVALGKQGGVHEGDMGRLGVSTNAGELAEEGKVDMEISVLIGDMFCKRRESAGTLWVCTGMLLGNVAGVCSSGASATALIEARRSFPGRRIGL